MKVLPEIAPRTNGDGLPFASNVVLMSGQFATVALPFWQAVIRPPSVEFATSVLLPKTFVGRPSALACAGVRVTACVTGGSFRPHGRAYMLTVLYSSANSPPMMK